MRYLVVATEKELELPWAVNALESGRTPIVTGVGGVNIIKALRDLPKDSDILNVGYCGGKGYAIGTVLNVGECGSYHINVDFEEERFKLCSSDVLCLTSCDFVTTPKGLPFKCIVDMELAYICALGFEKVFSIKYVSDYLNIEQYNEMVK